MQIIHQRIDRSSVLRGKDCHFKSFLDSRPINISADKALQSHQVVGLEVGQVLDGTKRVKATLARTAFARIYYGAQIGVFVAKDNLVRKRFVLLVHIQH